MVTSLSRARPQRLKVWGKRRGGAREKLYTTEMKEIQKEEERKSGGLSIWKVSGSIMKKLEKLGTERFSWQQPGGYDCCVLMEQEKALKQGVQQTGNPLLSQHDSQDMKRTKGEQRSSSGEPMNSWNFTWKKKEESGMEQLVIGSPVGEKQYLSGGLKKLGWSKEEQGSRKSRETVVGSLWNQKERKGGRRLEGLQGSEIIVPPRDGRGKDRMLQWCWPERKPL